MKKLTKDQIEMIAKLFEGTVEFAQHIEYVDYEKIRIWFKDCFLENKHYENNMYFDFRYVAPASVYNERAVYCRDAMNEKIYSLVSELNGKKSTFQETAKAVIIKGFTQETIPTWSAINPYGGITQIDLNFILLTVLTDWKNKPNNFTQLSDGDYEALMTNGYKRVVPAGVDAYNFLQEELKNNLK